MPINVDANGGIDHFPLDCVQSLVEWYYSFGYTSLAEWHGEV